MKDNFSNERRDFIRNLNQGGVSTEHRANMSKARQAFLTYDSAKVLYD